MDMMDTQARCPHVHRDNNKSSRRFKNWAKIYPLDHAMKLKMFIKSFSNKVFNPFYNYLLH